MQNKLNFTIIGSGVSGGFLAQDLTAAGAKVLILEAGKEPNGKNRPRSEIQANADLYWGGGIELNSHANLGILRPKTLGGGSVVNQALLDRFDEDAFSQWKDISGIDYFSPAALSPFYDQVLNDIATQKIPYEFRNGNAKIFEEGFKKCGHQLDLLTRAQKDCKYHEGNSCIECLSGCPLESKQSMNTTTIRKAVKNGAVVRTGFEVHSIEERSDFAFIHGINEYGSQESIKTQQIILAAGAIGNTKILQQSGWQKKLPALGKNFYTHPQYMVLGLYEQEINAHLGPLQTFKSNDPNFRKNGFKLENVFAPPVAISMLIPSFGQTHRKLMAKYRHFACIEVCVRDTNPGSITTQTNGKVIINKSLNQEDQLRRQKGLNTIQEIFTKTGAKQIIEGVLPIGLHLMGGCNIGTDPKQSVTNPEFKIHNSKRVYCADSSIFPNAPGINPSYTIMALAKKAAIAISQTAIAILIGSQLLGCSSQNSELNAGGLKVQLQRTLKKNQLDLPNILGLKNLTRIKSYDPVDILDFDCFMVNITGSGIVSNSDLDTYCWDNDNYKGRGLGIVNDTWVPYGTDLNLDVPIGSSRQFDVYGIFPPVSECGGYTNVVGDDVGLYYLGGTTADVDDDRTVSIPIDYTYGAPASANCTLSGNYEDLTITSADVGPVSNQTDTTYAGSSYSVSFSNMTSSDSTADYATYAWAINTYYATDFILTMTQAQYNNYWRLRVAFQGQIGEGNTPSDITTWTNRGFDLYIYNDANSSWEYLTTSLATTTRNFATGHVNDFTNYVNGSYQVKFRAVSSYQTTSNTNASYNIDYIAARVEEEP